ncbi:hypothetical protein PGB28_10615 [Primorskyibacter aestuariivivens]|uniref:DUF6902 family protein n=1 Tax=Primorskyibacter aestuariivivens TaxID=1888912 RepID=UPI002300E533|nr:hypothetical protein [Primorskyibacter aestuariivivens]MDA7428910.1 hypothetical protein [Primorskyibacter aestuariivivens]
MSNVVYLNVPGPQERRASGIGALIRSFSKLRRGPEDVFWLKENAELLSILECTGQDVPASFLDDYAEFYERAGETLAFFPQYYRFILSMALDLETLGMPGDTAESLCHWAHKQDLAGGETSDMQRVEAHRLMMRRNVEPLADSADAKARLRDFIARPDRFALPNKKAAFELTHIVFYLSEYGRKDPGLGQSALRSLENAGTLAFLDGNLDLLAEICIALRYAGYNPSEMWESWVAQKMKDIEVRVQTSTTDQPAPVSDQYHEYLTSSWLAGTCGVPAFTGVPCGPRGAVAEGRLSFHRAAAKGGALREMTMQLFRMGKDRGADWALMRARLDPELSDLARIRLQQAEQANPHFGAFFEDFARAQRVGS